MAARRRFFYWILHHLPLTDSASRNQYPGPSTLSNTCQVLSDEFTTKDLGIKRREEGWFFHLQWHLVLRNWNAPWSTIFLPIIITLTAYYKIRICITQKHMVFSKIGIASCQLSSNPKFKVSRKVNPLRRYNCLRGRNHPVLLFFVCFKCKCSFIYQ